MTLADSIAYIATIIGLFTFTPQVIRAWRTRETKDLSLVTYTILSIGAVLWATYGFLTHATPVIVANVVVLLHALSLIYLKLRYG